MKKSADHLELAIETINRKYGHNAVSRGDKLQFESIPRIPSGIWSLDLLMGGGWPRGRIVEIYGPESAGKSFIAYKTAALAAKYCHWCSYLIPKCVCGAKEPIITQWIDMEHTHDPKWAKKVGVNFDAFLLSQPDYGEMAVDIVEKTIATGMVGLVVIDSIPTMVPKEQLDKDAEEGMSPGAIARLMSRGVNRWTSRLNKKLPHPNQKITITEDRKKRAIAMPWDNLCTIICLNQLREHIGRRPMPPSPPGGRALRHAYSVRVALSVTSKDWELEATEKDEHEAVYQTVHFLTQKNKTFMPKKTGLFTIDLKTGQVDLGEQVIRFGKRCGLIEEKGGGNYSYGNVKGRGQAAFLEALNSLGQFHALQHRIEKELLPEIEVKPAGESVVHRLHPKKAAVKKS